MASAFKFSRSISIFSYYLKELYLKNYASIFNLTDSYFFVSLFVFNHEIEFSFKIHILIYFMTNSRN